MKKVDVLVLGAGLAGLATADEILRKKLRQKKRGRNFTNLKGRKTAKR